jgi:hypothetical protein
MVEHRGRTVKSMNSISPLKQADTVVGAGEPDVVRLAGLIATYAPHDGCFELAIPGVYAIRRSQTNKELAHAMQRPALCIVAQGAKSVMLGEEVFEYNASRMIVFSVELPVAAQVTQASHSKPFLCIKVGSRSLQDRRAGLESVSTRSASCSRKPRHMRWRDRYAYC